MLLRAESGTGCHSDNEFRDCIKVIQNGLADVVAFLWFLRKGLAGKLKSSTHVARPMPERGQSRHSSVYQIAPSFTELVRNVS